MLGCKLPGLLPTVNGRYGFLGESCIYVSALRQVIAATFLKDYGVQMGVALPDLVSRMTCCWTTQRDMNGPQGIIFKTICF